MRQVTKPRISETPAPSRPAGDVANAVLRSSRAGADECFSAMVRHNEQQKLVRGGTRLRPADQVDSVLRDNIVTASVGGGAKSPPPALAEFSDHDGDVIYGARACAKWLFNDDSDAARKRVFHLWATYRDSADGPGFFKLGATICLLKSAFRAWVAKKMRGGRS
jgi:hypothetical protein